MYQRQDNAQDQAHLVSDLVLAHNQKYHVGSFAAIRRHPNNARGLA
eukprot:CAMPEP_0194492008 /NCGR_PEP_ID=MMETSP0253-20130528/10709_1 /TAXON_ID=2966 /ORGANISM="Noctiluca scintillans" /LENGTH=45 /DNA_ID= /DNA_START= /DNA_END= /DNA_ORIENTATION=